METLFETLLLAPQILFIPHTSVRVFWAAEDTTPFKARFRNATTEFRQMLETFGLVILSWELMPCLPTVRPMTARQTAMAQVLDAYEEHGLDVESRRNGIQDAKRELGRVKGVPRLAFREGSYIR